MIKLNRVVTLSWLIVACIFWNYRAAAIPREKDGIRLQMKLEKCEVYTDGKSRISRHGRKATIGEFYAVILPSLQRLHCDLRELKNSDDEYSNFKSINKKKIKGNESFTNLDMQRENECGICLEPCTKMVLPNSCHAMCINCYRDWNAISESCPFCRGNIKRVRSRDFLPRDSPDALFMMYNEYLI
ncbi:hypothetical protein LIER_31210 [Lithospermum erythrorhizon]|uniref:RING-type domain-containing protein n=1 Tax=Lithospermum erythrorhizon TaxID=34254 RepID=A0AAV3RVK6_LITER